MRPATFIGRISAAAAALAALLIADQAVRFLPFAWVAARVTRPVPARASDTATAVRMTRWAIHAAARRIPWTVRCLARAVAANRLLARQGIPSRLWLGVDRDGAGSLEAHAWLEAGDMVVTGGRERARFKPLHVLDNAAGAAADSHPCSRS